MIPLIQPDSCVVCEFLGTLFGVQLTCAGSNDGDHDRLNAGDLLNLVVLDSSGDRGLSFGSSWAIFLTFVVRESTSLLPCNFLAVVAKLRDENNRVVLCWVYKKRNDSL